MLPSMAGHFFDSHIAPAIRGNHYRTIVEVGVDAGANTVKLLELAKELGALLICIDPATSFRPAAEYAANSRFIAKPSLSALKSVARFDCAIIDGDHNWYTVYNELKLVHRKLNRGGTVFLHDVRWPYARRDMYYEPRRIPRRFRHPYEMSGITPGVSALTGEGMNHEYYNAIYEGGSRNGVLTAVEDFLRLSEDYEFTLIEEEYGLAVLRRKSQV